jgi:DNA polymerase-1
MSIIATWHPTYAFFRAPFEWGTFTEDLRRLKRVVDGTAEKKPRITINPTVAQLRKLVRQSGNVVAVDIETAPQEMDKPWTGLNPLRATLKTIAVGHCSWGIAYYWAARKKPKVEAELRRILADPSITKVFHNGHWYDIPVLERYGFEVNNVEDTRDLRKAQCTTSSLALRYLGSVCTDYFPWKEEDEGDSKGIVFTDNIHKLLTYNAHDTVVTARVRRKLRQEVGGDKRTLALYEHQTALSKKAAEMFRTGIKVHKMNRRFLAWGLKRQYREQEKKLLKLVGIDGFRCTPHDMRKLIFKSCETEKVKRFSLPDPVDPKMYSKSGGISVNFDSLLMLMLDPDCPEELKPIIETYWEAESAWKARSTFVTSKKVRQAIDPDDGRLRPGWNNCGPDTGRWSCSKPNVMNLEQYLRAMYTCEPGHVLVHADFSQLELRVMAAVAGDAELQRRLDLGDVYTEDTKDWFNLPASVTKETINPKARKQSKIIHLASQYAAGTDTVYRQARAQDRSIKYQTVYLLHAAFKKTYAQTVQYWFDEEKRVEECGYSESRIMGRRRYYPRKPPITETANYPIQSTAADIANLAMLEIDDRLKKYKVKAKLKRGQVLDLVTQLHDAFDVECPKKYESDVRAIMQECMERPRVINGKKFVFPVEMKTGVTWDEV